MRLHLTLCPVAVLISPQGLNLLRYAYLTGSEVVWVKILATVDMQTLCVSR